MEASTAATAARSAATAKEQKSQTPRQILPRRFDSHNGRAGGRQVNKKRPALGHGRAEKNSAEHFSASPFGKQAFADRFGFFQKILLLAAAQAAVNQDEVLFFPVEIGEGNLRVRALIARLS